LVVPIIGAANRDPRYLLEPNRIDIARDFNPYLASDHGSHFCPGAALAGLEARIRRLSRTREILRASEPQALDSAAGLACSWPGAIADPLRDGLSD
jgi:cytochrome P450